MYTLKLCMKPYPQGREMVIIDKAQDEIRSPPPPPHSFSFPASPLISGIMDFPLTGLKADTISSTSTVSINGGRGGEQ